MTCIVGLIDQESSKVWMGADSQAIGDNGGASITAHKKISRIGDLLIGCAGSPAPGQRMRYALKLPEYNEDELDKEDPVACYIITKLIDAIKECVEAAKLKDDDKGYFLMGFKGRLFGIYPDDYQLDEVACGYNAIGSSTYVALGSLWTSARMDISPEARVELALRASAELNAYVAPPFQIESI